MFELPGKVTVEPEPEVFECVLDSSRSVMCKLTREPLKEGTTQVPAEYYAFDLDA